MSSPAPPAADHSALVSVDWLAAAIGQPKPATGQPKLAAAIRQPKLLCLDASVPPVVPGFNALNAANNPEKFAAIPGARRFDYDQQICKPDSTLPHMMPSAKLFEQKARQIGINRDSLIVVYDDVGMYASPRAWWMLRAMGHQQVWVLDGGLPAWLEAGQPVTDQLADPSGDGDFVAQPVPDLFCDFERVLEAIDDPTMQLVDARSEGRFQGLEPEPRPGVRSGHMPGAKNLPVTRVVERGRLKSAGQLRTMLQQLAAPDQKIITSCGSGITACVLTLAAWEAGYRNLTVYDGSWAEWGRPSKLPVVNDTTT